MKTLKQLSLFGLVIMVFLTSCTMEKRLYMSGYHIEWKKNKKYNEALAKNSDEKQLPEQMDVAGGVVEKISTGGNSAASSDVVIASAGNTFAPVMEKPTVSIKANSPAISAISKTVSGIERVKNKSVDVEKGANSQSFFAAMSMAKKAGVGLYILAVFIPWLAMGIHTGWKKPTLYNFLWCLLGYLPGVIHAFIVLGRD